VISAILLAAGTSSRYGRDNKLLVKYKKKPLLSYSLKALLKSKVKDIVVVLGKDKQKILEEIPQNRKIKVIFNKNYKRGMASSILIGLKKINKSSHGFMVCLSDMPKIKSSTYNKIINYFNKNKKIPCVPCYKNKNGNPVCFPISFKSKIKNIKGDQGAKKILLMNNFNKVNISSNSILIDFDKKSDFKK
jgi:molybdenum cofactor cytidylyltransferase